MALTKCPECNNDLSDLATSCPKCGAPRSAKRIRKTHPIAWVAVVVLIVAAAGYNLNARRQAALPPLPINVKYRHSLLGQRSGYVLMIENTSSTPLPLIASVSHSAVNDGRKFDLYIPARSETDISKLNSGWVSQSGDRITLENSNFKAWSGSIP